MLKPKTSLRLGNRQAASSPRVTQQANVASGIDVAMRLLSDTAHDLKTPLTSIRETLRLVRDGELGALTLDQQELLSVAMAESDRMSQLVGDMTQLERLRTGVPKILRRAVSVSALRDAVDQTLRPWAIPRGIFVLWDGADSPNLAVFGDEMMLQRLIVNLATNAIRASVDGGDVLIRIEPKRSGDGLVWSIIDSGDGIDERDLEQIALRHVSRSGGEGIGLAICRQLASLHFSDLVIRSRRGLGTEVQFETPSLGAHHLAQAWARWRLSARPGKRKPHAAASESLSIEDKNHVQRKVRLDPPLLSVSLKADHAEPRCADRLAAGVVSIGAASQRQVADQFDECLQNQLRMFDLVYRVDSRRWVWVLDADVRDVGGRIQMLDEKCRHELPEVRTTWSEPQIIPVNETRLASRLSDMLVRHSLNTVPSAVRDGNEVRLGTAPLEPSAVPAFRLDDELRRLSLKLHRQSSEIRRQAEKLRPHE